MQVLLVDEAVAVLKEMTFRSKFGIKTVHITHNFLVPAKFRHENHFRHWF